MIPLLELLKTPFGPYNEAFVLNKSSTSKNVLTLKGFMMECNGKPVGYAIIVLTIGDTIWCHLSRSVSQV
jgi:hypothetical protein